MRRLRKLFRLSAVDRRLLLQAAPLLGAVRLGLWLVSFERLRCFLSRLPRARAQAPMDRITWAVEIVSQYVPVATCLAQALTAQALLSRYGYAASLCIGVARQENGQLQAHAWLESGNSVVLGDIQGLVQYTPLPPLEMRKL